MRECWAFLRTMAHDYGASPGPEGYPWRRLTSAWNPHLRCPLMDPDLPHKVVTFKTRADARLYAWDHVERGRPIKVRISWDESDA